MHKILCLNKISPTGTKRFGESYTFSTEMKDPEGILVRSASMHEREMEPSLLAIARAGAGTNNIPVEDCAKKGVVVFNTPGANANAVKELALCALLLCSRKIAPAMDWVKTLKGQGAEVGKLVEKGKSQFAGPEIAGKALGVVGLGAIGILVANAAHSLGMEVYGYDPFLSVKNALNLYPGVVMADSLKELYAQADYLSLHLPMTPDTKGSINTDAFAAMKDGVRIVNLARGELVDSAALKTALESGKCAAYVTDFPSSETAAMDGVVAIPHLGASTPESEDNCAIMAARQVQDYLDNGNIVNSVNLPNLSMARGGKNRVCVIAKGADAAAVMGAVNATATASQTRGEYAYYLLDTDAAVDAAAVNAIPGVIRVRVLEG